MVCVDFEGFGFSEIEVVLMSGYFGVWGYYDVGVEKILVFYMMYDVQLVNFEDWMSLLFDVEVVDYFFGCVFIVCGVMNQKGFECVLFNVIEFILVVDGILFVNLMVLVEGEEEFGLLYYLEFVDCFEDWFKIVDGVFFFFNLQSFGGGDISMSFGVKGIFYFEMEVCGGVWGGFQ